jgi:hypothetical protein
MRRAGHSDFRWRSGTSILPAWNSRRRRTGGSQSIRPCASGNGSGNAEELNRRKPEPEKGFEPLAPCLQDRCSDQLSYSGLPRMVDGPQACGQFASVSRCGRGSGEVTIARAASQPTTTTSPPSAASTMKWFPVATMISSIARG